jgi:hypothetical protein
MAHAIRRVARPIIRHSGAALRHAPKVIARPHTWARLVCKAMPVAFASGGLLAPLPLNPTRLPEPRPAVIEPGLAPTRMTPMDPAPMDLDPMDLARADLARVSLDPTSGMPLTWTPTTWIVPPDFSAGSNAGVVPSIQAVPEPSSAGLFLAGIAGLMMIRLTMAGWLTQPAVSNQPRARRS